MSKALPSTYSEPVHIAIIGGTGLGALPSPPFQPQALIPPQQTPWGLPSSPITILSYTPPTSEGSTSSANNPPTKPINIAFLARHGPHHTFPPHQIPARANIAALKRLGVRSVIAFSAVGSLRTEICPRDFCVVDQIIDWTRMAAPCTFFEDGVVGHVSMADPVDGQLSKVVGQALKRDGVLIRSQDKQDTGSSSSGNPQVHEKTTLICISGPQFSSRAESHLYRSFPLNPPVGVINMSAIPEAKLFREAEVAYALVCMSTDYDSWQQDVAGVENEAADSPAGVSVAMVMAHMAHNSLNAKRAVEAILHALSSAGGSETAEEVIVGERLKGSSRGAVMGLSRTETESETQAESSTAKARERMKWLFGNEWVSS